MQGYGLLVCSLLPVLPPALNPSSYLTFHGGPAFIARCPFEHQRGHNHAPSFLIILPHFPDCLPTVHLLLSQLDICAFCPCLVSWPSLPLHLLSGPTVSSPFSMTPHYSCSSSLPSSIYHCTVDFFIIVYPACSLLSLFLLLVASHVYQVVALSDALLYLQIIYNNSFQSFIWLAYETMPA